MLVLFALLLLGFFIRDSRRPLFCVDVFGQALLSTVALVFLVDVAGLGLLPSTWFGLVLVGLVLAAMTLLYSSKIIKEGIDLWAALLILFVVGVYLHLFSDSYVLVARDSVQVPVFAKAMLAAGSLNPDTTSFDLNSRLFKYPPGFCILILPIMKFCEDIFALHVFKWLNVLMVPITPVVVAVGLWRMVPGPGRFSETALPAMRAVSQLTII